VKRLNGKLLEEKDMDSFLLEAHKKIVSDEIRQRKREEKLQRELTVASPSYNSEKDDRVISEISGEFEKTVPSGNDQSHVTSGEPDLLSVEQDDDMIQEESLDENQIVEQGLIHELCVPISPEEVPDGQDNVEIINSCVSLENMISGSAQHLSYLFETAIKSSQQEILDWHNYSFEFESKVGALTADGGIKDKTARSMIYKEMKPFLPTKITQANLRKKTHRARKHLMLFGKNGVGIDKIKLVSYSATEISKLTNAQIQNVIDQVKKYHQCHMTLKTVPSGNDQIKAEVSTLASVSSASQSKPTYDRSYFRNKILDQYPNLYRECSCENFDYYGITDETSCGDYICPLCKLGHDDEEIEGEYKAGSYFIKCEQREIEITA
jgi:predicted nucleic acid-binding OB-fold protein